MKNWERIELIKHTFINIWKFINTAPHGNVFVCKAVLYCGIFLDIILHPI